MKLLVFGSEGNIGKNTCKDLLNKFDIIGFDLKKKSKINYNFQKIDLSSPKKFIIKQPSDFSLIFSHYKSQPKDFKNETKKNYFKINNKILNTCLNISKKSKVKKIIYLSSCAVYEKNYKNYENYLISEKNKIKGTNVYSKFKILAEKKIKNFCKKNKIDFIILRLFHYYDINGNQLIENFKYQLKKYKTINIYGTGRQKLDFLYSKDLSKILCKLLIKKIKNRVLNVCTGKGTEIKKIAEKLVKNKLSINYQNIKENDLSLVGSNKKLTKLIDYYPKKNINSILKKLK